MSITASVNLRHTYTILHNGGWGQGGGGRCCEEAVWTCITGKGVGRGGCFINSRFINHLISPAWQPSQNHWAVFPVVSVHKVKVCRFPIHQLHSVAESNWHGESRVKSDRYWSVQEEGPARFTASAILRHTGLNTYAVLHHQFMLQVICVVVKMVDWSESTQTVEAQPVTPAQVRSTGVASKVETMVHAGKRNFQLQSMYSGSPL